MLSLIRKTLSKGFLPKYAFCQSYTAMKEALTKDLYSIELVNKQVNRRILAMAYTPGVGAVCEEIEQSPAKID